MGARAEGAREVVEVPVPVVDLPLDVAPRLLRVGPGMTMVVPRECPGCVVTVDAAGVHRFIGVNRLEGGVGPTAVSDDGTAWEVEGEVEGESPRRLWWFRCGESGSFELPGMSGAEIPKLQVFTGGDEVLVYASRRAAVFNHRRQVLEVDGGLLFNLPVVGSAACDPTGECRAGLRAAPAFALLVDEPEGLALLAHGAFGTRRIRERQSQLQLVGRLFGEPSDEDPSLDAWYCAQGAAGDPVELVRPRTDGTFERRLLDDAGAARCEEILSVATPGGGEVTWVTSAGAMGLTVRRAERDGVQSWLLPRAVGDSAWISPMVDGAAVMTRDAEARALGSRVRLLALDGSIRPEVFDDVRGAWSFDGAALHVVHEDPATPSGARWSYLTSVTEGVRDALSVRGPVFAVSLEGGEVMAFQEGPLGSERPVQLLTAGDTLRVSAAEALGDVSSLRRIEATGSPPRLAACASGECSLWEREPGGGLRRFAGGLAASIRSLVTRTLDGGFEVPSPTPWIMSGLEGAQAVHRVEATGLTLVDDGLVRAIPRFDGAGRLWLHTLRGRAEVALYRAVGRTLERRASGLRTGEDPRNYFIVAGPSGEDATLCILSPGAGRCESYPEELTFGPALFLPKLSSDGRLSNAVGPQRRGAGDVRLWRSRLPPAP